MNAEQEIARYKAKMQMARAKNQYKAFMDAKRHYDRLINKQRKGTDERQKV